MALAACVAAFCLAMGLREVLNIWIGTSAAALTSALALWLGARSALRSNLQAPTATNLIVGLAVGVLMSLATWWLYPLSVSVFPPIQTEVETLYALLRQAPGPVRAFPLLLLVVAAEELVWRGVAIDLFRKCSVHGAQCSSLRFSMFFHRSRYDRPCSSSWPCVAACSGEL